MNHLIYMQKFKLEQIDNSDNTVAIFFVKNLFVLIAPFFY